MLLRILKFGIVGLSGVIVNQSVLILLTKLMDYKIASLIAIETAIITNFILNSNWTFIDRKKETIKDNFNAFLKYKTSSFISAFFFNWITLIVLTEVFGVKFYISNLVGIAVAAIFNFLISNFLIFKKNNFSKT